MRCMIDIAPCAAPFDTRDPPNGIHANAFHSRKIYNDTAIPRSKARNTVTTAPHRRSQAFVAGEADTVDYVSNIGALNDQPRVLVDHRVVDPASSVVALIGWANRLAAQS